MTNWNTAAGNFKTTKTVKADFKLPEFYTNRIINWKFHVTSSLGRYDMILGRDILNELEMGTDFKTKKMTWDGGEVLMKDMNNHDVKREFLMQWESYKNDKSNREILDAKYEPADLPAEVAKQKHLNEEQKNKLLALLQKFEGLFDGSLGTWKGDPYKIDLKPEAKPYHARPFPIPKAYEATLKLEVERLCKAGVLKKVNRSEWGAPTFIIPKKDGSV